MAERLVINEDIMEYGNKFRALLLGTVKINYCFVKNAIEVPICSILHNNVISL